LDAQKTGFTQDLPEKIDHASIPDPEIIVIASSKHITVFGSISFESCSSAAQILMEVELVIILLLLNLLDSDDLVEVKR
jgi:hypothetical protein